jgi:quinol monooxygenase YgiN
MPDLPWSGRTDLEQGRTYVVMASCLPLARITSTLRFLRAVSAIRKQLRTADGLIGYTLRARPLARRYWTLSVWTDREALSAFMRTSPHVGIMSSLKPYMEPTQFVQWEITAADGRPSWTSALEHLASG